MIRILLIILLLPLSSYSIPNCKGNNAIKWNNCKGTFTFLDGEKYVGDFKDGRYHGKGTFTWPDGAKYSGEWKDDKRNGKGTFTNSNGKSISGMYKNGEKVGKHRKNN